MIQIANFVVVILIHFILSYFLIIGIYSMFSSTDMLPRFRKLKMAATITYKHRRIAYRYLIQIPSFRFIIYNSISPVRRTVERTTNKDMSLLVVLQQWWGRERYAPPPALKSRGTSYVLVPPPTFTTTFILIGWSHLHTHHRSSAAPSTRQ